MGLKRRASDKMNMLSLAKAIGIALGVMGGTITIGDRLWASKIDVAEVKTDIKNIKEDVSWIVDLLREGIKHSEHPRKR